MSQLFGNNLRTSLTSAITNSATSITVADASIFPVLSSGDYYLLTLWEESNGFEVNHEIIKVTAVSINTLTVERGQEGTTARAFAADTPLELRMTAGTAVNLRDAYKLGVNSQAANYTLALSDAWQYLRMTSSTANTVTVPANSTVAFPIGTQVTIRQAGTGQTTVVAASGVTITTPETLKLRAQHAAVTLIKAGTDLWDLVGDLEVAA